MQFTASQLRLLAIIPKVTASLSIVGSSYIAVRVFTCRDRRSKVHQRLLGAMSVFDVLSSLAYFLSTWPMPAASPFPLSAGTVRTCTAQGFFVQLGHTVLIYNACLAVYYLLAVRSTFSASRALGRWAERSMHFIAIFWPNIGGLLAALDGSINIAGPVACWIQSVPAGCSGESCKRGANAMMYRYIFAVFPVLASLVVATVVWICQYMYVRGRRQKNRLDSTLENNKESPAKNPNIDTSDRRSCSTPENSFALNRTTGVLERLVTRQALLYLITIYFTWGIPLALRWYQTISGKLHFGMLVFFAVVMPLQGFFNVLVYMRPTFNSKGRQNTKERAQPQPSASPAIKPCSDDDFHDESSRRSSDWGNADSGFVGAEDCIDDLSGTLDRYILSERTTTRDGSSEELEP